MYSEDFSYTNIFSLSKNFNSVDDIFQLTLNSNEEDNIFFNFSKQNSSNYEEKEKNTNFLSEEFMNFQEKNKLEENENSFLQKKRQRCEKTTDTFSFLKTPIIHNEYLLDFSYEEKVKEKIFPQTPFSLMTQHCSNEHFHPQPYSHFHPQHYSHTAIENLDLNFDKIFEIPIDEEEAEKCLKELIEESCKARIFNTKQEKKKKQEKEKEKEKEKEAINSDGDLNSNSKTAETSEAETSDAVSSSPENETNTLALPLPKSVSVSQEEKEKEKKINKRLDYFDKEINKCFIRKPLELILNFILKFQVKTSEKLELGDFSDDVKIDTLKNLHKKTIEDIFTLQTEINFEKNPEDFLKQNNFIQFKIGEKKLKNLPKEKIWEKIQHKINLLNTFKKSEGFKKIKEIKIDFFYKKILDSKFFKEEIKLIGKKFGEISEIEKRAYERKATFLMEGYKK